MHRSGIGRTMAARMITLSILSLALMTAVAAVGCGSDTSGNPPASGAEIEPRFEEAGQNGQKIAFKTDIAYIPVRHKDGVLRKGVAVDITATDAKTKERVTKRCVVEVKSGDAEYSEPYELKFNNQPLVIKGEAYTRPWGGPRAMRVGLKGTAVNSAGETVFTFDKYIKEVERT